MIRFTKTRFAALFLLLSSTLLAFTPDEADWNAVQDAINKGLPKTALEKLEPLAKAAVDNEDYDEAIKAIALKISLEGDIEGGKAEEKIVRMLAAIEQSPEPMRPVMDAILANWFWSYFQQNQWRFMNRTEALGPRGDDINTWSLSQILSEIDQQFEKALKEAERLKRIPVAEYDELLEKGTAPDSYRPTLFDFVAHNAIEFYLSGAQAGNRKQDAFDLSAESPIFSPSSDFMDWRPDTSDRESLTLKAIVLYQQLMRFHEKDADQSAYLDNDLARYHLGNNLAFGEGKDSRFQTALSRFAEENAASEISARALHDLGTALFNLGSENYVRAHEVATAGVNRFPESVGGRRCHNLIQQIEGRQLRVATERVWSNPRPTIDVYYRNVEEIHFRLVPFDFNDVLKSGRFSADQLDQETRNSLLSLDPIQSWSEKLDPTIDYQETLARFDVPKRVPTGSYYLIASANEAFDDEDNQIAFSEVWESKLALVSRMDSRAGVIDGFVLESDSGKAIPNATVKAWRRERNQYVEAATVKTNQDGYYQIPFGDRQNLLILAQSGKEKLSSFRYISTYKGRQSAQVERTLLFTDRAIYRPGQTVQYKGVCTRMNTVTNDYASQANRDVTIAFMDPNGKLIEQRRHRTNDYGSFHGAFTAPRDRLMGNMSIRITGGPAGYASVSVEEYKRPKFKVELDPPLKAAKLKEKVELEGQAVAYSGASINDATVSWRVVRNVRYPVWWFSRCWWMPPQQGGSQEIAHGTTSTNAEGRFQLEFEATPDVQVPSESEPTFSFMIYVDVTDATGETRSSSRSVNVGYTALSATVTAPGWLTAGDAFPLTVRTSTLNGDPESAEGIVEIFEVTQPKSVTRASMGSQYYVRPKAKPESDPSNPNSWPLGKRVQSDEFETDGGGLCEIKVDLPAGLYRVSVKSQDRFGNPVSAETALQVIDPESNRLNIKVPDLYLAPRDQVAPGGEYEAIWGTGYDTGRAFIEVIHDGRVLQSYWTKGRTTQRRIKQKVDESMRGGFHVRTTMIRENRSYVNTRFIDVPWSNKELKLRWERIVSKLKPGAKETWTAIIEGADSERQVAELVATLYDASLDAYRGHNWIKQISGFKRDSLNSSVVFHNQFKSLNVFMQNWKSNYLNAQLTYRRFPANIIQSLTRPRFGLRSRRAEGMGGAPQMLTEAAVAANASESEGFGDGASFDAMNAMAKDAVGGLAASSGSAAGSANLDAVQVRENLNETAFFFPRLVSNKEGLVRLEFTMPEALTEWRFLGFAHDQSLRSGFLSGSTVTSKDLMVQPNPPRFVREGDEIEFTVKVINKSPTNQSGNVRLTFTDARTDESVDALIGNLAVDQEFEIAAGTSQTYGWRLKIPDELGFMTYKAVASTGKLDDGEVGYLAVLSRRILVTESLPLPIRDAGSRDFQFKKLIDSDESDTLAHQSLTVQMASNPSWYAVLALPYLMEYPHECSEQTFNRLYANVLARKIADSDPKIKRIFEQWRATPALDSPLEKNQDLKSVMLEETPWFRQAENESQARRNIGLLFDRNRLTEETNSVLRKLTETQLEDGAWPWFPGGRSNQYITLYINCGFGRLRHLGVNLDISAALKSLAFLDDWADKQYRQIRPDNRDQNHLGSTISLYLYARTFFLNDQAIRPEHKASFEYWTNQAEEYWVKLGSRQSQAHLAIALKRLNKADASKSIMRSLKERSVSDDELGMFWRDTELSWWWYRAPIETQALMIEAFDEVMDDQESVEACKVWLLKQKQTQDWKTTKATADAVYSLLLRGTDLLASSEVVAVSVAGDVVRPDKIEPGTGFYEVRIPAGEVSAEQGKISVNKVDQGVAWGSVHWQYMEDVSKVTGHEATPLKLTKQLFVKINTNEGQKLQPVDGPVNVGDELVVRIVLKSDRDMEYLHLKDSRGSGTEPVNVLSRYKFQDGLAYYESTRDTASHFYIDYLPKGTYVFEYSTRVQLKGKYQSGIAEIQSMYAPEFNSHSSSTAIVVE